MPLTRDFNLTIRERLERDPAFRQALVAEAIQCFLDGDVKTGQMLLRTLRRAG